MSRFMDQAACAADFLSTTATPSTSTALASVIASFEVAYAGRVKTSASATGTQPARPGGKYWDEHVCIPLSKLNIVSGVMAAAVEVLLAGGVLAHKLPFVYCGHQGWPPHVVGPCVFGDEKLRGDLLIYGTAVTCAQWHVLVHCVLTTVGF